MDESTQVRVGRACRSWVNVRTAQAVRASASGRGQEGSRSAVTGGKHLDGFDQLVQDELIAAGGSGLRFLSGRKATLPGYYRATKSWDLIALQDDEPILAVEYKSMQGSEGKNLNNRADEVFGVAEDLRAAEQAGLLASTMRRAYIFVMGIAPESTSPAGVSRVAAGKTDAIFQGASYLERAAIMCERMRSTGLYHLTWTVGIQEAPFSWSEPRLSVGWDAFAQGISDMFEGGKVKPLPRDEI